LRVIDKSVIHDVHQRDGQCLYGSWKRDPHCIGYLSAHHIQKRSQIGPDIESNLITLCMFHHEMAEKHLITSGELRHILRELYGYSYTEEELGQAS